LHVILLDVLLYTLAGLIPGIDMASSATRVSICENLGNGIETTLTSRAAAKDFPFRFVDTQLPGTAGEITRCGPDRWVMFGLAGCASHGF